MTDTVAGNLSPTTLLTQCRTFRVFGCSAAKRRMVTTTLVCSTLLLVARIIGRSSLRINAQALSPALALPGGEFLAWLGAQSAIADMAPYLAAGFMALFFTSLGLWFATGNCRVARNPVVVERGSASIGRTAPQAATAPPIIITSAGAFRHAYHARQGATSRHWQPNTR